VKTILSCFDLDNLINNGNLTNEDDLNKEFKRIKRKFAKSKITCLYLSYQGYKEYFGKEGREIPGVDGESFELGLSNTDFYKERLDDDIDAVFKNHYNKKEDRIHALLLIAKNGNGSRKEHEEKVREDLTLNLGSNSELTLYKYIHFEHGLLKRDQTEWFGFKDGIGNPKFFPNENTIRKSEFEEPCKLSTVLTPCKSGSPNNCGSFVAFLKFQQHLENFEKTCEDIASQLQKTPNSEKGFKKNLAGALLIGRHKDGTPVTLSRSEHGDVSRYSFNYSNDPKGARCPFHAHIRKANPREGHEFDKIVRRGMIYSKGRRKNAEKGLLFMSFQADLESQFEYMLDLRLNKINWNGEKSGSDPLLGTSSKYRTYYKTWGNINEGKFPITKRKLTTFKGGLYFFAPSIPYIEDLGKHW